jgi:hypothetical protein
VFSSHCTGERQYAHKGTIAPLGVVTMTVSFRRLLLLSADYQALPKDLDRVIIPLQLGNVRRHDKLVVGLSHVESRCASKGQ